MPENFKRLVAYVHDVEAESHEQADKIARDRACALNDTMRPLGLGTAWAPIVTDTDSDDGGLMDILLDLYLLDETDDDPERNPRPGYIPADETVIPERLIAWRDAAVKAALPAAQCWLLTAVGESMTHEGSFADACALAERSWIARNGEDGGVLVWSRLGDGGAWELGHEEPYGGLVGTGIRVRAR